MELLEFALYFDFELWNMILTELMCWLRLKLGISFWIASRYRV